jgi:hypothetical protein
MELRHRSQQISVNITENPDPVSFSYDQLAASRPYNYIFGYQHLWLAASDLAASQFKIHWK